MNENELVSGKSYGFDVVALRSTQSNYTVREVVENKYADLRNMCGGGKGTEWRKLRSIDMAGEDVENVKKQTHDKKM